ncbi:MAG TPA: (Fe-S)-binding protein, partial [Actinomycetota bacterium]
MRLAIGAVLTFFAVALTGRRAEELVRLITVGKPAPERFDGAWTRLRAELVEVFGQRKLLKRPLPGLAHFFTFWGFVLLLTTIAEAYGELFSDRFALPLIGHWAVLGLLQDLIAVAVLASLLVFAAIRLRESPARRERRSRFFGSHTGQAWVILAMIAGVIVTLLLYRGARAARGTLPYGGAAFASHAVGRLLDGLAASTLEALDHGFLLAHLAVVLGFLVLVTYSKHLHIFTAPFNVAFSRRPDALGPLATLKIDPEEMSEEDVFGAGKIEDFKWKQLLDLVTCTECGRCQDQCPAWNTGKPLSPKLVITDLRDHMFAKAPYLLGDATAEAPDGHDPSVLSQDLVTDVVGSDVLWSCTTCGACVEQCPVDIEHVDTIVDMRRYQVLMESRFPTEAGTMLRNIENSGDPWGLGGGQRLAWKDGLEFDVPVVTDRIPDDVEYLYWVGCAGALEDRARKTVQSTARLLHRAGVSFAVLGPRESCTGDPARRLGNEYLYQTQAQQNIGTLSTVGARKVIASCPHCFNTLAREYPDLGATGYEVIYHSELLQRLVAEGRLEPSSPLELTVTYHD